jgi:hypothetical protein
VTDQSLGVQQLPVNALYALHKKIISTRVRAPGKTRGLFSSFLLRK